MQVILKGCLDSLHSVQKSLMLLKCIYLIYEYCLIDLLTTFERKIWKKLGNVFHLILEVRHLLNGIFQSVQERYTIHEVVEHPFFTNILCPDNTFFKPFQKQAAVMDEERVCLFSQRFMKTLKLRKIKKFKI